MDCVSPNADAVTGRDNLSPVIRWVGFLHGGTFTHAGVQLPLKAVVNLVGLLNGCRNEPRFEYSTYFD